jgi:hypothetical protein
VSRLAATGVFLDRRTGKGRARLGHGSILGEPARVMSFTLRTMEDPGGFRAAVRDPASAMVNGSTPPYDAAREIWGRSAGELPDAAGDDVCIVCRLVWGALTDGVELRPRETDRIQAQMIAAAREWLAIESDREAEARYFDHWVHDVLGYERTGP